MSQEQCDHFANSIGAFSVEVSAKEDEGIQNLFMDLAREVHKKALRDAELGGEREPRDSIRLTLPPEDEQWGNYGCKC